MTISILFPAFCHAYREPDPQFHREMTALDQLQISWHVVNIESLIRGDIEHALKYLGEVSGLMMYRGWILHPHEYELLYRSIAKRGGQLLTSPEEYSRGLLFPEFYRSIESASIPATWTEGFNSKRAEQAAESLGPPPYFIKDYAKSAKEIWPQGCVVNRLQDMKNAIRALRKYRGDRVESGIVIRPFVKLRALGISPFGGQIFEEYRLFYFQGDHLVSSPYDRHDGNVQNVPNFDSLLKRFSSPFFSADVVVTATGEYRILELGDGGCSSLSPGVAAIDFYRTIRSRIMLS